MEVSVMALFTPPAAAVPMLAIETLAALIVSDCKRLPIPVSPIVLETITDPETAWRDNVRVFALPLIVPEILMPPVAPGAVIVQFPVRVTLPANIIWPVPVQVILFARLIVDPVPATLVNVAPPADLFGGTANPYPCKVANPARRIRAEKFCKVGPSVSLVAVASGPVIAIVLVAVMFCVLSTFNETPL